MTLRTLNYGNYGIFLIMGHAGFCPSTVKVPVLDPLGFLSAGARHCGAHALDHDLPPAAPQRLQNPLTQE